MINSHALRDSLICTRVEGDKGHIDGIGILVLRQEFAGKNNVVWNDKFEKKFINI